jgi:predicted enzyme involved in methoxymalonyl-ACP biosynthesis
MWYLARLRLSRLALDSLASSYTAAICARMGKARKCVAVDLDNNLWGGMIGEDGIEGIRLGEDGMAARSSSFRRSCSICIGRVFC